MIDEARLFDEPGIDAIEQELRLHREVNQLPLLRGSLLNASQVAQETMPPVLQGPRPSAVRRSIARPSKDPVMAFLSVVRPCITFFFF